MNAAAAYPESRVLLDPTRVQTYNFCTTTNLLQDSCGDAGKESGFKAGYGSYQVLRILKYRMANCPPF